MRVAWLERRARRTAMVAAGICAAVLGVAAAGLLVAGGGLVGLFPRDPAIVAAGRSAMVRVSLTAA